MGLDGRIAYSLIRSERTDPDSGLLAPSPFHATHAFSAVINRTFGEWLETGIAYRTSTGAPFTPVAHADFDGSRGDMGADVRAAYVRSTPQVFARRPVRHCA